MGLMPDGIEHLPLFRRIDRGKVRGQYFRPEPAEGTYWVLQDV